MLPFLSFPASLSSLTTGPAAIRSAKIFQKVTFISAQRSASGGNWVPNHSFLFDTRIESCTRLCPKGKGYPISFPSLAKHPEGANVLLSWGGAFPGRAYFAKTKDARRAGGLGEPHSFLRRLKKSDFYSCSNQQFAIRNLQFPYSFLLSFPGNECPRKGYHPLQPVAGMPPGASLIPKPERSEVKNSPQRPPRITKRTLICNLRSSQS